METLEKKEQLNALFEIYQSLLTDKQVQYFKYYFVDDYSLQEIAEIFNVSRNAVFDQLKKVEMHLNEYEEKLKLYAKMQKRSELLKQYKITRNEKLLDEIGKLDD